jgi:rsbT antagonist protein RsbS
MMTAQAIPLITLFGNLIVPIQVTLSDGLITRLTTDVTRAIEGGSVSGLIIDVSGVDMMDSHITRCLRDLALTARFMGVDTIVCGMRPAVVITLIEMGLSVPGISSALNLERALEVLLRRNAANFAPPPATARELPEHTERPSRAHEG